MITRLLPALALFFAASTLSAADPWVVYEGGEGPGKGKHLVLLAGDDEYHSEEAMPQLGKILARHHGFKVTVLFAVNKKDGTIDPSTKDNIPGLEALQKADLMVMFLRFRNLPDEQLKHIADYVESGKPVVGLRTSTHAFALGGQSKYKDWNWTTRGGFGRKVLGETWVAHHGGHGSEATRGIVSKDAREHPIVKGIKDGDIFGPTDVYRVNLPLPGDSKPVVLGQVVAGMKPSDPPVKGKKNEPMMPIAWTKTYTPEKNKDKKARVFCSTMGSSEDLANEGFRRLLVNACYWAVGLEGKIPDKAKVDLIGEYKPTSFKKPFVRGIKPEAHAMK